MLYTTIDRKDYLVFCHTLPYVPSTKAGFPDQMSMSASHCVFVTLMVRLTSDVTNHGGHSTMLRSKNETIYVHVVIHF